MVYFSISYIFSDQSSLNVNIRDNSLLPGNKYRHSLIVSIPVNINDSYVMEFTKYEYYNFILANYIALSAMIGLQFFMLIMWMVS